jgi:two-component system OmpR family response regulator
MRVGLSVLIIEHQLDLRQLLVTLLLREGLAVAEASEGRDGIRQIDKARPDFVILDAGLPDLDDLRVLERFRHVSDDSPVLVIASPGTAPDTARTLGVEPDDYLTTPFSRNELLLRMQAVFGRWKPKATDLGGTVFDDGMLHVDFDDQVVTFDKKPVNLNPTEYRLLATLVRHQGQVLSSSRLVELAWGDDTTTRLDRRLVKNTLCFLLDKLEPDWSWQEGGTAPIEIVRGFGFRYRSRSR